MRQYQRLAALYAATVLVIVALEGVRHVDNNFAIFRASFAHLAAGRDLYARYPAEHADRFKYSPTFALLFAPFALLPALAAFAAWSALNVFVLAHAVRRVLPPRDAALALALVYLEVVRTTQRAQSNALVTGLMILGFVGYERRRPLAGATAVALGTFVKIFPLATFTVAVFQPRRWRAALLGAASLLLGLALPLAVTSPARLAGQYASWAALEAADARADADGGGGGLYGGVMAQLRLWFGVAWPNWPVQLAGTLLLLAPLLRVGHWRDPRFRLGVLCSLLVFVVLFNPQAESPSFVIAVTGVAIWFAAGRRTPLDVALMTLTVLVVSVSSTKVMPTAWHERVFVPYRVKTIPCLLVWLVMQAELLGLRRAGPRVLRDGESAEVDEGDRGVA